MDDFGLNYSMAPVKTVAEKRMPGCRKDKELISVLACAKEYGSEKILLMCIGTACKPRFFNRETGSELALDYFANRKSWMTFILFQEWLCRFDAYIGRTPNRTVVLLIDNFSSHRVRSTLP